MTKRKEHPVRVLTSIVLLTCCVSAAYAGDAMKPTAAQKMTSPQQKRLMAACQRKAADRNVPMAERAKFVMDCMTTAAKPKP
jgi:hypothetical protein